MTARRIRRLTGWLLIAILVIFSAPPAKGDVTPRSTSPAGTYLFPSPSGPTTVITTEGLKQYVGFPSGVEKPDGSGYLIGYGVSDGHWDNTADHVFRTSEDGVTWSSPWSIGTGSGYGFAGMAAETMEQGGRIYLLQVKVWLTSQTVTEVRPYFRWSDDNGKTWTDPVELAGGGVRSPATATQTWSFYPGSIAVLADGTLLAAGYGGANGHVLVRKSTDRGQTWTAAGDITPVNGRPGMEPQLCPLADGRVAMPMRSDYNGTEWMLMSVRDTDGTWEPNKVINYDASGSPGCREVAPGFIGMAYRGWVDRTNSSCRPMRVAAMTVDPGWGRGNGNVEPGESCGRFLYGVWLKRGGEWLIVHGVESPFGPTAAAGEIRVTPVRFLPVPARP